MEKKKILMVTGGVDDQIGYEINIYNVARADKFGNYEIQHAVLIPEGKIKFPKSLNKNDIEETPKHNIFEGLLLIQKMNIDVIFYIPTTWRALTTYRCIFEALKIPIIGPSAESQGLAFNKITTRAIVQNVGIKCAPGCIINYDEKDNLELILKKIVSNNFNFPVIVKAPCDDDSLGVYVVKEEKDLIEKVNQAFTLQNKSQILIEKLIPGREVRTIVLEDENGEYLFLPEVEFVLDGPNDIRKLENKQFGFLQEKTNKIHTCCKRIFMDTEKDKELIERLRKITTTSLKTIQINDFGICDFRYDPEEDEIYLLEFGLANWFTDRSNYTMCGKQIGMTQEQIIDLCFNNAIKRFNARNAEKK